MPNRLHSRAFFPLLFSVLPAHYSLRTERLQLSDIRAIQPRLYTELPGFLSKQTIIERLLQLTSITAYTSSIPIPFPCHSELAKNPLLSSCHCEAPERRGNPLFLIQMGALYFPYFKRLRAFSSSVHIVAR